MILGGIDGFRKGWILVKFQDDKYSFGIYETFKKLLNNLL